MHTVLGNIFSTRIFHRDTNKKRFRLKNDHPSKYLRAVSAYWHLKSFSLRMYNILFDVSGKYNSIAIVKSNMYFPRIRNDIHTGWRTVWALIFKFIPFSRGLILVSSNAINFYPQWWHVYGPVVLLASLW